MYSLGDISLTAVFVLLAIVSPANSPCIQPCALDGMSVLAVPSSSPTPLRKPREGATERRRESKKDPGHVVAFAAMAGEGRYAALGR
jgi:hypothetical protein